MKYIRVSINPALIKIYTNQVTYVSEYEHMRWCRDNCRSEWFNDCEYYSSICFADTKEALKFALKWGNLSEEEKVWSILRWS